MGWPGLVTQPPKLLPPCLCACCYSTSSVCSCTHSFFLAPVSMLVSPTAEFQPVESAVPQFQCREREERTWITCSHPLPIFAIPFGRYIFAVSVSLSHCCWSPSSNTSFLKHLQWLIKSWNIQDFFGGGLVGKGNWAGSSLWQVGFSCHGTVNPGPLHWKVDFQPLDQKVPEMSEIALYYPPLSGPTAFYSFLLFLQGRIYIKMLDMFM